MERGEASPKEPGEDWTEWEVVDMQVPKKDEPILDQKEGELSEPYNKQEQDMDERENMQFDREYPMKNISDAKAQKQQEEKKKEEDEEEEKASQETIEAIYRANNEIQKQLEEMRVKREEDKQKQLQREQEYLRENESWKMEQLKVEMEKEALKKEKEFVQKKKADLLFEQRKILELMEPLHANDNCYFHSNTSECMSPDNKQPKCELCKHCTTHLSNHCPKCLKLQYEYTNLLTVDGVLNDQEWSPCVEQKYGWILHNHSGFPLKFKVKLTRVGNKKDITILEENMFFTYEVDIDKEMEIVVHARAPSLCGKYTACWRMVNQDNEVVGPPLEMKLIVRSTLKDSQEKAVRQMIADFGFHDRDAVIAVLSANEWNVATSAEELLEQANQV